MSFLGTSQDSTRILDEVEIVGINLSKFVSGTNLIAIRSGSEGSLSSIGDQSSIYFKNYGSQQLSTISLRGTSANHTSVIWNGIPVNSPTLGQTDFSVWPMFLTNQIIVQKGGGSSLFGSGAIGGTVIIDNSNILKDSLVSIYSGIGSFGQRDAGLKLQFSRGNLTNEFKAFGSKLENDFGLQDGSRQQHASVDRLAFSNKLGYIHGKGRVFTEVAYAENDRDIQPTKTSASRSTLLSRNVRAVVNNTIEGGVMHHSTIGFISDQTIFNDSSITNAYRVGTTHAMESTFRERVFLRYGATGMYEWAESDNLDGLEVQIQGHLFASGTISGSNESLTLNLRQAIYQGNSVFVPSLGFETITVNNNDWQVIFRGQVSRDYRVPTFNDLFWQPGGNVDLRPETSLNFEIGSDLMLGTSNLQITAFTSRISDWIQWTPENGVWSPSNLRKVRTKGVEFNFNTSLVLQRYKLLFEADYTHTLSSDQGLGVENQLPYVPKNSTMISTGLIAGNSKISISANCTGERFTTLSNSPSNRIDEFLLLDSRISHNLKLEDLLFQLNFNVRNIGNVEYENLKNTAMPGRAFLIEITTKI